jgi:hypothetical protein
MTMTEQDTIQPKSKRRRVATSVFLGLCALLGFFGVRYDPLHIAPDRGVTVSADSWTPADGFRDGNKCYRNYAFSGPHEVPCGNQHPLPAPVRQCAATVFIAGLSAYFTGNPVVAGMSTTAAGCGAVLF